MAFSAPAGLGRLHTAPPGPYAMVPRSRADSMASGGQGRHPASYVPVYEDIMNHISTDHPLRMDALQAGREGGANEQNMDLG